MLKGIDISQYQPGINFNSLKNFVDFVIARATYGNGFIDRLFAQNRDGLRNSNIPHGFYHYAYPQYNRPEDEANWFLQIASPQDGEVLCLDFEENWSGDHVAWCKTFLDTISANLNGYRPLIYLNQSRISSHNWNPVINAGYGLWLADWDNNPEGPGHRTSWPVTAIRQYTDSAQIPGIRGGVDADVFYGDLNAFNAYGFHSVRVQPDIPNPGFPTFANPAPVDLPPESPAPVQQITSQTFIDSLKSRKFILAGLASLTALVNSTFHIGLSQDQLMIFLLPILAFIIVEGIADIVGRSKA